MSIRHVRPGGEKQDRELTDLKSVKLMRLISRFFDTAEQKTSSTAERRAQISERGGVGRRGGEDRKGPEARGKRPN